MPAGSAYLGVLSGVSRSRKRKHSSTLQPSFREASVSSEKVESKWRAVEQRTKMFVENVMERSLNEVLAATPESSKKEAQRTLNELVKRMSRRLMSVTAPVNRQCDYEKIETENLKKELAQVSSHIAAIEEAIEHQNKLIDSTETQMDELNALERRQDMRKNLSLFLTPDKPIVRYPDYDSLELLQLQD